MVASDRLGDLTSITVAINSVVRLKLIQLQLSITVA